MSVQSVNLLSHYGTILRQDGADEAPLHAPLWPLRDSAQDVCIDIPAGGLTAPLILDAAADQVLEPAAAPNLCAWRRIDLYRFVDRLRGRVRFLRRRVAADETFLLITPLQVALLRALIGHDWRAPDGDILRGDSVMLSAGFTLTLGDHVFNLTRTTLAQRDGGLAIESAGANLFLRPVERREIHELRMLRRLEDEQARFVESAAEFAAAPNAKYWVRGEREYTHLPLVAAPADRDWLHRQYWRGGTLHMGAHHARFPMVREAGKYVLTTRGQEGMVFDDRGVSNEPGYLTSSILIPGLAHFSREGDVVHLNRAVMAGAPMLAGTYVSVCNGNMSNYYHWVIDGLLPLHMMRPYLAPGTKLLIPRSVPEMQSQDLYTRAGTVDHLAALRAWGLDDLEIVLAPPPVVRVEQLIYHDFTSSLDIPAVLLRRARADILARYAPRTGGKKIYMRRRGMRRVINAEQIEPIVQRLGFVIHELEGMSPVAQIELFRDADIIVAPHGAGLTNLIYCHAGTKVLEMSPEAEYRSCFVELSDKLDLLHAILPCPTEDNGFWTNMRVDPAKFTRLLDMLLAAIGAEAA